MSTTMRTEELPLATSGDLTGTYKRRFVYWPVPAMGKRYRIQSLSELERSRVENSLLSNKGRIRGDRMLEIKCRWIQATAVDEDGNLLHSESDIPAMLSQDSLWIDQLIEGVKRHVGISDDDLADQEKNYGTIPADDSR